jgi:hypothetical protein
LLVALNKPVGEHVHHWVLSDCRTRKQQRRHRRKRKKRFVHGWSSYRHQNFIVPGNRLDECFRENGIAIEFTRRLSAGSIPTASAQLAD